MNNKQPKNWLKFSGIGIEMAVTVIIFLYLGKWLGSKFNHEQIGILIGIFLGLFGSIYNLIKQINE
tara:strand:+ start:5116 stop:5313 length:198 start_codon:yes stop_codon:yes gene_type:complete